MGLLSDMFDLTPTGYVANKVGEALGPAVVNATNQAADIEAINAFFAATEPVNDAAQKIKDEWASWYQGLGWYAKSVDTTNGPIAINWRNAFLRANVTNDEEKKMVDDFVKGGPTVNPVTGQPILKNAAGDRAVPPKPLIPTQYKIVAIATAAGVATLVLLKKLHII